MPKYKIKEWEIIEKCIAKQDRKISEQEKNYKKATTEDKKVILTAKKDTVYRIELPSLPTNDDTKKQQKRIARTLKYQSQNKEEYIQTAGIIAYSEHKSWTPFTMQTSAKGGRPYKVFSACEKYRRKGHLHNLIIGEHSYRLAKLLYDNEVRYLSKKYPKMRFRPAKDAIRLENHIAKGYIEWQAENNYKYETKNFDAIAEEIEQNSIFDPLNF